MGACFQLTSGRHNHRGAVCIARLIPGELLVIHRCHHTEQDGSTRQVCASCDRLVSRATAQDNVSPLTAHSQEDFVPGEHGRLAIQDGRTIADTINKLLTWPFALKFATRDFHPADHVSFASQHEGAQPVKSEHTIANPENPQETQTT